MKKQTELQNFIDIQLANIMSQHTFGVAIFYQLPDLIRNTLFIHQKYF